MLINFDFHRQRKPTLMSLQPLENPLCANFNWQHTLSPVNILVIYSLIYLMVLWLDEFLLTPFRQDFYGPSMRCYISLSWKQFEFNTFSLLNFCSCMFALFIREVYGSKKFLFFFWFWYDFLGSVAEELYIPFIRLEF